MTMSTIFLIYTSLTIATSVYVFSKSDQLSDRKPWDIAETDCVNKAGHLISIQTEDKYNDVLDAIHEWNETRGPFEDIQSGFWIGLSNIGDGTLSQQYNWTDGVPFEFGSDLTKGTYPWKDLNPNNVANEHCIKMTQAVNFRWEDLMCTAKNYWICDVNTTTQNTTLNPTNIPTNTPTNIPTNNPINNPTNNPPNDVTNNPTISPIDNTQSAMMDPSMNPSISPITQTPTKLPTTAGEEGVYDGTTTSGLSGEDPKESGSNDGGLMNIIIIAICGVIGCCVCIIGLLLIKQARDKGKRHKHDEINTMTEMPPNLKIVKSISSDANLLTVPENDDGYKNSLDEGNANGVKTNVFERNKEENKMKLSMELQIETGAIDIRESDDDDEEDKYIKKSTVGGDEQINIDKNEFIVDGDSDDNNRDIMDDKFDRKVTAGYLDDEHDGIVSDEEMDNNENNIAVIEGINENEIINNNNIITPKENVIILPRGNIMENDQNDDDKNRYDVIDYNDNNIYDQNIGNVKTPNNNIANDEFIVDGDDDEFNVLTPKDNGVKEGGF